MTDNPIPDLAPEIKRRLKLKPSHDASLNITGKQPKSRQRVDSQIKNQPAGKQGLVSAVHGFPGF
jgi:hypothetical protein